MSDRRATVLGIHFLLGDGRRCSITVMGTLLEETRGARVLGTCAFDGRADVSVLAGSRPIVMIGILHDALTRLAGAFTVALDWVLSDGCSRLSPFSSWSSMVLESMPHREDLSVYWVSFLGRPMRRGTRALRWIAGLQPVARYPVARAFGDAVPTLR